MLSWDYLKPRSGAMKCLTHDLARDLNFNLATPNSTTVILQAYTSLYSHIYPLVY